MKARSNRKEVENLPVSNRTGERASKKWWTLGIVSINPVRKLTRILTFFPFQRHTRSISRT
ncbi:hypothetical protein RB6937 [Rhodopirellula baltica SH 1]|uniref:Uncharacterized protein n=1 Tax=Rhodopirellula baltica (strain DSM 10527 / NCIMB 13988 / SH1) TaxID=243090 RepID=Q7UPH3_RHOBA|nr:hypothetical protein RB6937 [Rhodopirellula baltica SH 1]